ncbi:hypothetical protein IT412_00670 [Candidatus Peregrinibacteria bacterium]|nr:hypothetical protein [Candidatus Peregrinibacteria bacterium]
METVTEVAAEIVKLLTPLDSENRQRAVSAAMILVGEKSLNISQPSQQNTHYNTVNDSLINNKAVAWMDQNQLTLDNLQEIFQIEPEKIEVIASDVPGKNKKEKTLNSYVLTGISKFISTGDSSFDDKLARELCTVMACYDNTNHAAYMKGKGNELAGSKDTGWKLTAPGLKKGAQIIRELLKVN